MEIPAPIRRSDEALHALFQRVAFSRYLNPVNSVEAKREFAQGAAAPPFAYQPLDIADDLLFDLDRMEPPRDHPAGMLVGQAIDGVRRMVHALQHRTEAAFHELNDAAGWYPSTELLDQRYVRGSPTEKLSVSAWEMMQNFEAAFAVRNMDGWRVEADSVMSARVLVDSAKQLIRVNPQSKFRPRDLTRLVVHEIDVHARRAINGSAQPLLCFSTGLPGSLATEEGLAMVSEEKSGTASPGVLARQAEVCRAIDRARHVGFRELYEDISRRTNPGLAWGICLRVKRGLAAPGAPGVYAKDSVYLAGRNKVRDWIDAGGDIQRLYVGKVGVDDPIDEWVQQGWVTLQPVPTFWRSCGEATP